MFIRKSIFHLLNQKHISNTNFSPKLGIWEVKWAQNITSWGIAGESSGNQPTELLKLEFIETFPS